MLTNETRVQCEALVSLRWCGEALRRERSENLDEYKSEGTL
jgi:hypothetical protein